MALTNVNRTKAVYEQIVEQIDDANRAHRTSDNEFQQAFTALAASEAAVSLDGAQPDAALKKAVLRHKEAILMHEARLAGLQTRLEIARAEVKTAASALAMAEEEWRRREGERARTAIRRATTDFILAVQPHFAAPGLYRDADS